MANFNLTYEQRNFQVSLARVGAQGAAAPSSTEVLAVEYYTGTSADPQDPSLNPAEWSELRPADASFVAFGIRQADESNADITSAEWHVVSLITETAVTEVLVIRYSTEMTTPGNPTDNPANWSAAANTDDDRFVALAVRSISVTDADIPARDWRIFAVGTQTGGNPPLRVVTVASSASPSSFDIFAAGPTV